MHLIAALEHLARHPGPVDLDALAAGLDAPLAAALRGNDPAALRRAFGDTRAMWCLVLVPDEQPGHEAPDDTPDPVPDDTPDTPDTDTPREPRPPA